MKLASILPIKNMDLMFEQPYAMLLAHLKDYYPKCNNKNCYKIMDNSLIELGSAVDLSTVLQAAEECNADEVILPDVFRKGRETLESVKSSIATLYTLGKINSFRYMAVCQGETKEEFEWCFKELCKLPEIHCIGIPKVSQELTSEGRPGLEYLWKGSSKVIHLLGVWYNLEELTQYKNPELIRSVDTCIPALLSKTTDEAFTLRPKKTIDLYNDEINAGNYEKIMSKLHSYGF